jgi:hypothetical protein
MYLTIEEYAGMGGTLDDATYARCAVRADALITRMTHGRIQDESPVRECVKYAAFDLAEAIAADARTGMDGAEVAAVANDGVSITYAAPETSARRYARIVRSYLDGQADVRGVPLLYAGVDA